MQTYTNVVLDRAEREAIRRAALHLPIAFPRMHEEMPRRREDRLEDHYARVLMNLIRDTSTGTFDNLTRAEAVLAKLIRVLAAQASLNYWLAKHAEDHPARPVVPSDEPTSGYQQYVMLADIRDHQLTDAQRALEIVQRAARLASPLRSDD